MRETLRQALFCQKNPRFLSPPTTCSVSSRPTGFGRKRVIGKSLLKKSKSSESKYFLILKEILNPEKHPVLPRATKKGHTQDSLAERKFFTKNNFFLKKLFFTKKCFFYKYFFVNFLKN